MSYIYLMSSKTCQKMRQNELYIYKFPQNKSIKMKTRNIFALCALIILSIITACNSKTGIKEKQAETNTHDSFSIREKYAPDDSAPLERKLIPPKQIDDLRNFQVVYCFDIDSSCPLCDYHLFSFCC